MSAGIINIQLGCEDCTFANAYGQDCKHGLMFPVLAFMAGYKTCPNFKAKTTEQINEQLKLKNE